MGDELRLLADVLIAFATLEATLTRDRPHEEDEKRKKMEVTRVKTREEGRVM